MNRKITIECKTEFIPSNTIKVYFYGQNTTEYIYIWNTRFPCEPCKQVNKQSYRCLRYGHVAKKCKCRFEKCSNWGDNELTKNTVPKKYHTVHKMVKTMKSHLNNATKEFVKIMNLWLHITWAIRRHDWKYLN